MNTGIYEIRNIINSKCYVGSANSFIKRFNEHKRDLRKNEHHNAKLQRAWNKHGAENFEFNKIIICSKENLLMYEQRAIDIYDTVNNGYNILPTAGSTIGMIHSSETKLKMSESAKGRIISIEQREKIGNASRGRIASNESRAKISAALKGVKKTEQARLNMIEAHKKRSPEIGLKISASKKGKKQSIEACNKMSESHKLRYATLKESGIAVNHSEETKAKISASHIGKKHKPTTDETKEKLSIIMKESWVRRKALTQQESA